MPAFPRSELQEMIDRFVAANDKAGETGDWGPLAEFYAKDAIYSWNNGPKHEFVARGRQQRLPGGLVGGQFAAVAAPKLRPLLRIVPIPAAQGGARRDIFQPSVQRQRLLAHAARPQPFDKKQPPISAAGRVIHAPQAYRRLHPRSSGGLTCRNPTNTSSERAS